MLIDGVNCQRLQTLGPLREAYVETVASRSGYLEVIKEVAVAQQREQRRTGRVA